MFLCVYMGFVRLGKINPLSVIVSLGLDLCWILWSSFRSLLSDKEMIMKFERFRVECVSIVTYTYFCVSNLR